MGGGGGRTFSRRVINLANVPREMRSIVCLPQWFKDDLRWWSSFADCFNGKVRFMDREMPYDVSIYTDSSLSGFGRAFGQDWFLGVWSIKEHMYLSEIPSGHIVEASDELSDYSNINVMELWPVLCAVRRWDEQIKHRKIVVRSDNSQIGGELVMPPPPIDENVVVAPGTIAALV